MWIQTVSFYLTDELYLDTEGKKVVHDQDIGWLRESDGMLLFTTKVWNRFIQKHHEQSSLLGSRFSSKILRGHSAFFVPGGFLRIDV